jgi:DnaJ-class molecular chaperone
MSGRNLKPGDTCRRCLGKGGVYRFLRRPRATPYRFDTNDSMLVEHYVTCDSCDGKGVYTDWTLNRWYRELMGHDPPPKKC